MDKIKRLILCSLPVQKCNLKCEYCYISKTDSWGEHPKMKYSVEHIVRCLSRKRLGGICLINLTGYGETLLQPEIDILVKGLVCEGHYVEIVTNGLLTTVIEKILNDDVRINSRIFFKLSFHYSQLKKRNLLNQFWKNVEIIKNKGASFTLELMANDDDENNIRDIINECSIRIGAVCHATIGRDDSKVDKRLLSSHSKNEYYEIWKELDSPMLKFKLDVIGVKRKEFCYAGEWSLLVDLYTGNTRKCYKQPVTQNILKDPDKPIEFAPVGHNCTLPYCMNAHAHMTWGIIPTINTLDYYSIRNRECEDGTCWVNEPCRSFFKSRLYESNKIHGVLAKWIWDLRYILSCIKGMFKYREENLNGIIKYVKRRKNDKKEL